MTKEEFKLKAKDLHSELQKLYKEGEENGIECCVYSTIAYVDDEDVDMGALILGDNNLIAACINNQFEDEPNLKPMLIQALIV